MGKRRAGTRGKTSPTPSAKKRAGDGPGGTEGKRPRAPSAKKRTGGLMALIAHELYVALERLHVDQELLAVVGSWGDTLDDAEILALLRGYNRTGRVLQKRRPD
jgi:hypothetical protein